MMPSLPCPLVKDGRKLGILKSALRRKDSFIGMAILHENGLTALNDNQIKIAETEVIIKTL